MNNVKRKVVLKLTTQKDLVEHESAATTFAELKRELKKVKWSGMRVVERSTKMTLQHADAILPQGDFILFLVPEKVKSGVKTSGGAESLDDIEGASYNQLRSHMSWLNRNEAANFDMSGGTEDLRKRLLKYKGKGASKPKAEAKAKTPVAKKPEVKGEAYKPTPREDDEDDEDYEDRIAFEKKAFIKKAKKAAEKAEEERLAKEKADAEAKKKAEAKAPAKKEKTGLFGKKKKAPVSNDPVDVLEKAREDINNAINELVEQAISGGDVASAAILEYSVQGLDEEVKKIRSALSGGGFSKIA